MTRMGKCFQSFMKYFSIEMREASIQYLDEKLRNRIMHDKSLIQWLIGFLFKRVLKNPVHGVLSIVLWISTESWNQFHQKRRGFSQYDSCHWARYKWHFVRCDRLRFALIFRRTNFLEIVSIQDWTQTQRQFLKILKINCKNSKKNLLVSPPQHELR